MRKLISPAMCVCLTVTEAAGGERRMNEVTPRAPINSVCMSDSAGSLDEIRVGPTLHGVMLGTKPMAGHAE